MEQVWGVGAEGRVPVEGVVAERDGEGEMEVWAEGVESGVCWRC